MIFHHVATQNPIVNLYFIMWQFIILSFYNFIMQTQDPGHSTKFVTLPSLYITLLVLC